MRLSGTFWQLEQLVRTEERAQLHAGLRQRLRASFLAVDDTGRRAADEAGSADRLDGLEQRTPGGDDVLDEAHPLAPLVDTLEPVRRPVLLRLLAHDQERQARRQRRGSRQRDGAELGPREPRRGRLDVARGAREPRAERAEQVRPRLETVFVEVPARAAARA